MDKKEICWRWLNIIYFCGGIVIALISVITLSLIYPTFPRELFVFALVVHFIIIGVPFMSLTTKWLLPKQTSKTDN